MLSSVFDTFGFAAPAVLVPKLLLQELCRKKYDWDELMTDDDLASWRNRLEDLTDLFQISIPRCLNISDKTCTELIHCQLYHFSDAFLRANGILSILRCVANEGHLLCNFVVSEARLSLLKIFSFPRLELMAATFAVQCDQMLKKNLMIEATDAMFWTDLFSISYMINNVSIKDFCVCCE